jgi:hypothetical protein
MHQPKAAATEQHHQVLELCIDYISDPATLARVSLVSRVQHSQIKAYVQQQLPSLVKNAVAACKPVVTQQRFTKDMSAFKGMDWLLSTAGPAAVGAPAVAHALLRLGLKDHESASLPELAFAKGLQLSTQQIIAASRERVAGLHHWTNTYWRRAASSSSGSGKFSLVMLSFLLGKPDEVSEEHACSISLQSPARVLLLVLLIGPSAGI